MSLSFAHDTLPGRVVFGAGASRDRLAGEVEQLGARRVLLVASGSARAHADAMAAALGDRVAGRFDEVAQHVPVELAERARAAAAAAVADCVLAVGGGSAIGTAKAIALTSGLPIVAVPTTYAGSEMTPVWGLTEASRKTTGRDLAVLPRVVVYDPELTRSLSPARSATSGLNALAHCVEAFYAPGATPIASLLAEEGARALAAGLPEVVRAPAELAGRSSALYGAYLAGAAFAVAGSSIHHRICHVLGGAYDLPHAELHTVVLPQAVAFVEPAVPAAMARVRRALGAPDGTSAAAALHDLALRLGAPTALREIGMREADLDDAAALVAEQLPAELPRPAGADDVRGLLAAAFAGVAPR